MKDYHMDLRKMVNEEIVEMQKKGKNLHWTGINDKGKRETGKQSFARMRDMNDDTYALKREVINIIYEAKNLLKSIGIELPRQTVRIIDIDPKVFLAYEGKYIPNNLLGCATMGGNDIYIPAKTLTSVYDLKEIVYHELLHSAFCVSHNTDSIIMHPYGREKGEYSSQVLDAELIKEVKKARNIR